MLGTGSGFQGFSLALQPGDKGFSETGSQIRVFSVGLMAAAPPGVAENINVRGPHGQTVINIPVALCRKGIVFCSCFGGNGICDLFQKLIVKHRSHADGLRKACCGAAACEAVQCLVPPVVFRHAEALDCRGIKAELACLFFHCHLRNQKFRFFSCFFSSHYCCPPS